MPTTNELATLLSNMSPCPDFAADTLEGVTDIARFIGKSTRQTAHLLNLKMIPAYKLGGRWHMRRSTYTAYVQQLEANSLA